MMNRPMMKAALLTLIGLVLTTDTLAQAAEVVATEGPGPSLQTIYIMLGVAILQVIIILALSGIMKGLGGNGSEWAERLARKGTGGAVILLLMTLPSSSFAASPGAIVLVTTADLFWWLVAANAVLFVVILAQLNILRGMVKTISGREEVEAEAMEEPSFADAILQKLTRTVDVKEEKDILMDHEYDGIRELDNVLPPWWLWLFYGTIIWGLIYVVNVHITGVLPHQADEYQQEMAQAKADIAAYQAQFSDLVDENTVTAMTSEGDLASGKKIFLELCKACHGAAGEGGVGPNMTDEYWIHGGGIKDLSRTVKYGVPEKGIISWATQLKPAEIQAVSSYILTLKGTNPPGAKEPQGEIWKEADDATAPPVEDPDTAPAVVDSAAVAVLN